MKKLLGLVIFTLAATSCGSKSSKKTEDAPLRLTAEEKGEIFKGCNSAFNISLTANEQRDMCNCSVEELDKKYTRDEFYRLADSGETSIKIALDPIEKKCTDEVMKNRD